MTEKNNHSWQADGTHPELMDKLRVALREIFDPELGLNIIQLGLVRDVIIENEQAHIKMILTTPFCPYGPAMLDMTRKKAEQALTISTSIEMGIEMWDFSNMEEGATPDWGIF